MARFFEHREAIEAPQPADRPLTPAEVVDNAGGWMARAALLLAAGWIAAVICITAALVGFGALGAMTFVQFAALAFTALLPAGLLAFAGAAAREGARAQAQARRLADAADRMMNPSPVAEAAARRLGISVRGEIAALDQSLAETLTKLAAVETVVTRQKQAVDQAAAIAQQGAGALVSGLERERAVLAQISSDLATHATRLGETILRQSQSIAGAAQHAEGQLRAADQVLEGRLNAFGSAAALIGDRTSLLTDAANATASSTQRLETALSGALDTLAQATSLTEAAKKSTEAATLAANTTAGAVRETTNRAIEDARRVAELIRAEAQTVEREAAVALERLREAAEAARLAAVDAREVTGALPPPRTERGSGNTRGFPFIQGRASRDAGRRDADRRAMEALEAQRFEAQVARAAAMPVDQARRGAPEQSGFSPRILARAGRHALEDRMNAERGNSERWTWRDMLRSIEPETAPAQKPRETNGRPMIDAAPNEFEAPRGIGLAPVNPIRQPAPSMSIKTSVAPTMAADMPSPVTTLRTPTATTGATVAGRGLDALFDKPASAPGRTAQMMETVGVRLGDVFTVSSLDRIAARARNGTQARRRAVRDAAPEAVLRLAERFDVDPRAREEGARFLEAEGARISDLLGRGRASMTADATRAFLLIDAASS